MTRDCGVRRELESIASNPSAFLARRSTQPSGAHEHASGFAMNFFKRAPEAQAHDSPANGDSTVDRLDSEKGSSTGAAKYDAALERRVVKKLDRNVMPIVFALCQSSLRAYRNGPLIFCQICYPSWTGPTLEMRGSPAWKTTLTWALEVDMLGCLQSSTSVTLSSSLWS